jgi:hypothetical protein
MNPVTFAAAEVVALHTAASKARQALDQLADVGPALRSANLGVAFEEFAGATGKAAVAGVAFTAAAALATNQLKNFAAAASPNGMQSIDKAASLLSATIGQAVLPGFVMLGASLATAADLVRTQLAPGAATLAQAWAGAIPAFVSLAQTVAAATTALMSFGELLNPRNYDIGGAFDEAEAAQRQERSLIREMEGVEARRARGERPMTIEEMHGTAAVPAGVVKVPGMGSGGELIQGPTGTAAGFIDNFDAIVKDMQASGLGGKQGFTDDIANVWKQIQVQSQRSALEAKQMSIWSDMLKQLQTISREMSRQPAVVGRG